MNKYEETLERILNNEPFSKQYIKDRELLEVLFERATPKKVTDLTPLQNLKGCPKCNKIISPLEYFCKKCGQALDWTE